MSAIKELPRSAFDIAVLEQADWGGLLPELSAAGLACILDAHNVEWWLLQQIGVRADQLITRWHRTTDARKFRKLEERLLKAASMVVAVSNEDSERLRSLGARRVAIHPNGVDLDYFSWSDHCIPGGANLLMTGTMAHPPNSEACRWLCEEIMPALRKRLPSATLTLAGGGVTPAVRRLHDPALGITIVGPVPDMRPFLSAADVFIVPLRVGSGTRLKALEALASGLPIVATPIAIEGLGLVQRDLVLVGETVDELVEKVLNAISDLPLRSRLVMEGRRYVERYFDWRQIAYGFEQTLLSATTPTSVGTSVAAS